MVLPEGCWLFPFLNCEQDRLTGYMISFPIFNCAVSVDSSEAGL